MSRIELTDSAKDALVKMAEGNLGAIEAMMEIIKQHDDIDPQAMFGGLGTIMILDTWEIYGTDISVLFSHKCGKDVRKMLMIMRAVQLGLFSEVKLREMAADQTRQVNIPAEEWERLDNEVCGCLEEFAKPAAA